MSHVFLSSPRTLAALALAVTPLASWAGPPAVVAPLGPFLPSRVTSVAQFVRVVQAEPVVRARYARFFHLPESQVAHYLGANLKPDVIPKSGEFTLFNVRTGGLIYPVRMQFPQGTRVLTLRDGRGVLLWPYGNPLMPFQTAVETRVITRPEAIAPKTVPQPGRSVETTVPTVPQETPVPNTPPGP